IQAIYNHAAELLMQGMPPAEVEQKLVEQGLDADSAAVVVAKLQEARADVIRGAGKKNMIFGALWCIGGTGVTVGSYLSAAGGSGGGSYVIAWGAIVFGAIQFFRGVSQMSGG